jgi:RNA polymerase sigma-70 factor (ECF subfamily)
VPAQLTPDEERDLITNLAQKPDSFRQLYQHYFPRIYAYVASRVSTRQDAEDIVSDVFVSVVEAIERFEYRGDGSFAAWLFRIAYNEVQAHYRQSLRQNMISLTDVEIESGELSQDEALSQKEQTERLHAMLKTLSARRQEIITLRYFGELRNQEIAEVLGLNEKTIASHLSRGLEDLQSKYRKMYQHE